MRRHPQSPAEPPTAISSAESCFGRYSWMMASSRSSWSTSSILFAALNCSMDSRRFFAAVVRTPTSSSAVTPCSRSRASQFPFQAGRHGLSSGLPAQRFTLLHGSLQVRTDCVFKTHASLFLLPVIQKNEKGRNLNMESPPDVSFAGPAACFRSCILVRQKRFTVPVAASLQTGHPPA